MIVAETRGTGVMCITRTEVPQEDIAESPGIMTWRQRTGTVLRRATRTLRWHRRRTSTSARHRTTIRAPRVTTNKNQLLQKVTSTYGRRRRDWRPGTRRQLPQSFPPSSHYRPLRLEEELRLVFSCQTCGDN
uniref:(northern house mosquito) hypothetical protein n=1 Tax=Culex pipiens TaxID=7175 RepID=A0A8D8L652_CULPI